MYYLRSLQILGVLLVSGMAPSRCSATSGSISTDFSLCWLYSQDNYLHIMGDGHQQLPIPTLAL